MHLNRKDCELTHIFHWLFECIRNLLSQRNWHLSDVLAGLGLNPISPDSKTLSVEIQYINVKLAKIILAQQTTDQTLKIMVTPKKALVFLTSSGHDVISSFSFCSQVLCLRSSECFWKERRGEIRRLWRSPLSAGPSTPSPSLSQTTGSTQTFCSMTTLRRKLRYYLPSYLCFCVMCLLFCLGEKASSKS